MNFSLSGKLAKEYSCYAAAYFFSYAAIGALFPLIGQYLRSIGFDGVQIGSITSAATVIGLFASPILGKIFHHDHKTKGHLTVMILCIGAAIISLVALPVKTYIPFLLLYMAMAFFQVSVMPFTDTLMMRSVHSFGGTRKWGAAGFALSVLLAGKIADEVGLFVILIIYCVAFFLSAIFLFIIMKEKNLLYCANWKKGYTNAESIQEQMTKTIVKDQNAMHKIAAAEDGYGSLFANKRYLQLLLCAFFLLGTNAGNNTYFGFLYTEAGGTITGIGTAFLLMAGSEIPFMAWFEKLTARFTLEKVLFCSMVISAVRFLWYGMQPPYWLLLGLFFLQGAVNGIILVGFASYVSKLVPVGMLGMAMALYQALSSNLSTIVCQFVGGSLLESYGSGAVYLFFGIYNVVGVLLYLIFQLYKENLHEKSKKIKKTVDKRK